MNKEVKEIIQKIEDVRDNPAILDDDGWCDNWMVMSAKECNILLDYINQLEYKLNKINTIVSNIDEKRLPKYQDKIRDIKFWLEYDFWANQKVECDGEMSPEELEIHNILLKEIKKEGDSNE